MILYTNKKHRFGKTVNIEGIIVEFNLKGEAEISSKEELEILVKAGLSRTKEIEKEQEVLKENTSDVKVDVREAKVKELETSINLLSSTNKALEREIVELRKENELLKESSKSEINPAAGEEKVDEGQSLAKELSTKTKAELTTLCEELGLDKNEYQNLKVDDLRKFIITKAENL